MVIAGSPIATALAAAASRKPFWYGLSKEPSFAIICRQRKRIAAAIEGEPRLFSWLVARDFMGKTHQKRPLLQPPLPGPYVGFEPQADHQLTGM